MKELFKNVVGYDGLYQVSNLGRIKSLDKKVKAKGGSFAIRKGKFLAQHPSDRPYFHVVLTGIDKKRKTTRVHNIVALAFLGPRPEGFVIDHIDGDVVNNSAKNLEYVTVRENTLRGYEKKRGKLRGAHYHKVSKKWQSEIRTKGVRTFLGTFETEREAHESYKKALSCV